MVKESIKNNTKQNKSKRKHSVTPKPPWCLRNIQSNPMEGTVVLGDLDVNSPLVYYSTPVTRELLDIRSHLLSVGRETIPLWFLSFLPCLLQSLDTFENFAPAQWGFFSCFSYASENVMSDIQFIKCLYMEYRNW